MRRARIRLVPALVFLTMPCQFIYAQPPEGPPAKAIRLGVKAGGFQDRALRYALLPDPLDLKPGNAALTWLRAGRSAAQLRQKAIGQDGDLVDHQATPLERFPKEQVRAILKTNRAALNLSHLAAHMESCDWGIPPLTVDNIQDYVIVDEVQYCRDLARLLILECRLNLSEGKIREALASLRTGFALARHVAEGRTLIHCLVGVAIASIMLNEVEEVVQLPDAPNLYWPLTVLPSPLIELSGAMKNEMDTIHRSFPALRKLEASPATPLSPQEVEETLLELVRKLRGLQGEVISEWQVRLGLAVLTTKLYPDAKKSLLDRGLPAETVDAMPALQVVGLYHLHQYNQLRDDILKWSAVPYWQGKPHLNQVENRAAVPGDVMNPFYLLLPAAMKSRESQGRLERKVAQLRCVEALRLHTASTGKPPARLQDIRDLPIPIDPETGKSFDEFYRVEDGIGILHIPAPWDQHASIGRKYEVAPIK